MKIAPMNHTNQVFLHFRSQGSKVERYGLVKDGSVQAIAGSLFHEWIRTPETSDISSLEGIPFCYSENIYFLQSDGQVTHHKSAAHFRTDILAPSMGEPVLHIALVCGNRCGYGSSSQMRILGFTWLADHQCAASPCYAAQTLQLSSFLLCSAPKALEVETTAGRQVLPFDSGMLFPLAGQMGSAYTFYPGDIIALPVTPPVPPVTAVFCGNHREPLIR